MDHMDLDDFDPSPRVKGRAAREIDVEVVRELTEADLALLDTERAIKAPPLKRISERHQALARTIATGTKIGEAAIICGYDISRVSILVHDPTFQELVEFYRRQANTKAMEFSEQLTALGTEAIAELRNRLEEEPEFISTGNLAKIVADTADRTGYGPSSNVNQTNIHIHMASRLEAARKREEERRKMIDVTPEKPDGAA